MDADDSILKKSSFVRGLNTPWEAALPLAKRLNYKKHQTIDISNRTRPFFYYILSGTVRLSYLGENGEERTILYAGPGTLMNVPTIVADDAGNSSVLCTEDVEIACFDPALLTDRSFASTRPELLINLVHSLCVHLVIHSQLLGESSHVSSLQRVCQVFLEMSRWHGGRSRFAPGMTQQELSTLLGIHRTTLTRILLRLKEAGVVSRYSRRELSILNPDELKSLAGERF